MKYDSILSDLEKIKKAIAGLDFIKYSFVYGSTARLLVHEDSDIDLLFIGENQKDIKLVSTIEEALEEANLITETDVKYYNLDDFKKLRTTSLFLRGIQKDCKTLDQAIVDIHQVLGRR